MKNKTNSITALILLVLIATIRCGNDNKITGNGSQTPNALVGILYQSDGKTPASGVRVHIRPQKSLADTSGIGLSKRTAVLAATDSVVTDSAGRYSFDTTLDAGTYVVEAASGNNAALIDSVAVTSKDSTDTLAPDTLRPAGALKGIIKLSEGGDPRKVFILAFGIDRFARVNADGSFKFSALAEGKYDLRLISSLDNYGVLDTVNIPVESGDTLNMDTISLPFTGIPTPKNVSIAYDTLKQIVALSWSKAAPTLVNGYYVYRRNVDSNTVLARINTSAITDTLYKDSTGIQDQTYEYRVVAVDKNATEGTKSAGVSVIIAPAIRLVDSIGVGSFQGYQVFNFDKKGNLFIADVFSNSWKYYAFGSALTAINFVSSIGLKYPAAFDFDSSGNLFTINQDGIFKIDSSGNRIDTISRVANNENKSLLIDKGSIWVTSGYIAKISIDGKTVDTTGMVGADGLVFNKDTLLIGGNGSIIRLFSQSLIQLQSWQLDFHADEIAWSLTKDEQENVYISGYHSNPDSYTILIYDSNRKYKGKIKLGYLAKNIKVRNGKLYASTGGLIKIYQIK
jgi:hypothetical protein